MAIRMRLGEAIVDAAVAKLKNGMPGRVAGVNADYQPVDGITITAPVDASYYTSGIESIPAAPALIVAEGPMDLEGDLEGPHSLITHTRLLVYILEQDPSRQVLGKKLQRQARAVVESLWDDAPQEQLTAVAPFAGGRVAAYRIVPEHTTPGRVFDPTEADSWRGFYLVAFRCAALEE